MISLCHYLPALTVDTPPILPLLIHVLALIASPLHLDLDLLALGADVADAKQRDDFELRVFRGDVVQLALDRGRAAVDSEDVHIADVWCILRPRHTALSLYL